MEDQKEMNNNNHHLNLVYQIIHGHYVKRLAFNKQRKVFIIIKKLMSNSKLKVINLINKQIKYI